MLPHPICTLLQPSVEYGGHAPPLGMITRPSGLRPAIRVIFVPLPLFLRISISCISIFSGHGKCEQNPTLESEFRIASGENRVSDRASNYYSLASKCMPSGLFVRWLLWILDLPTFRFSKFGNCYSQFFVFDDYSP